MPLVGKHVYQCFKGCSFVPYFDPDPLEQLSDHCICEHHHLPNHQQPATSMTTSKRPPTSSSSTKRPVRGKSGGSKFKGARVPSVASLLDVGFNEWSPQGDHEAASKKQNGRTTTRAATRRKSDRNAPNLHGEWLSESNKPGQKECQSFRFYEDTSRYMAEYRARHVQRLVGFDGSSEPDDLTFGENIPDPYIFKTAPFKRAFEAIQSAIVAERKQMPNGQKGSRACPNLSPTSNERVWRPSDVKHLPGITTQPFFTTTVDTVCAGMRHVGQDVFKPSSLPTKRRPDNSTPSSRRSLVSRQNKTEENAVPVDKLELALAQSRLAMRDRLGVLGVNEENSYPSRQSSYSSSRSPDNLSTKTTTLSTKSSSTIKSSSTNKSSSTTKSKADWLAMSVDQGEATRTMLLFLQKARGDVDRSREKRTRRTLPNGKTQDLCDTTSSTPDKQRFTAMLCRTGEKSARDLKSTEMISESSSPPIGGQLKNGRLKVKVFRPSGTGDIKLEEALKAGRLHVPVGLGT